MAKLTKKQQREVSLLLSCLKSASRTQQQRQLAWTMLADSDETKLAAMRAYNAACEEARDVEQQILTICAGGVA